MTVRWLIPIALLAGACAEPGPAAVPAVEPRVDLGLDLPEVEDAQLVRGDTTLELTTAPPHLAALRHRVRVRVCATAGGEPSSAFMNERSGDDAVDEQIIAAAMRWRYAPVVRHGRASPFCEWRSVQLAIPAQPRASAPLAER